MRIQSIIFLIFSFSISFAQSKQEFGSNNPEYIINTENYQKGIYYSFEEFKYNNPSKKVEAKLVNNRLQVMDSISGEFYKIDPKGIWGFSNGNQIFVLYNQYCVLILKGRYLYFEDKGMKFNPVMVSSPTMLLAVPTGKYDKYIINFNTGNIFLLDKSIMRNILKLDDPKLLETFNKEKKKNQMLQQYISLYNTRNKARIK